MLKSTKEFDSNLLCPICFKRIPLIKLIKESNVIKIQTLCSCNEKENILALTLFNSLMKYTQLDSTELVLVSGMKYCLNCLSFFCDEAYDSHIKRCNTNSEDNELDKISEPIWHCKSCNINLCYQCKINNKHKYHDTQLYSLNYQRETINKMIENFHLESTNNYALFEDLIKHLDERITLLKGWKKSIQLVYSRNHMINQEMNTLLNIIQTTAHRSKFFCYNQTLIDNIQHLVSNYNKDTDKNHKEPLYNNRKTIGDFNSDLDKKYFELQNYFNSHYALPLSRVPNTTELFSFRRFEGEVNSLIQLSSGRLALASNSNNIMLIEVFDSYFKLHSYLKGHTDFVLCLIELRDKKIASGSMDCTIRIWNTYSSKNIETLSSSGNYSINCLIQLNNDNLMSADDNMICIWDINSLSLIASKECHTETINTLLQLPNYNIVSANITVKIWNPSCSICLHESIEDSQIINMIIINSDQFALLSEANSIKIWNSNTLQCMITLSLGENFDMSLILSNTDNLITCNKTHFFIWDQSFRFYEERVRPSTSKKLLLQLNNNMLVFHSFWNSISLYEL